jgi:YegS/Rv2252/BmrU family lipid kinase
MVERRRFAAIVNPISGRRNMLPRVRTIARAVERLGGRLDVLVTQWPRHATQLAAQLGDEVEAVLVVGGDGTVGEVVNGLAGGRVPMLILRTGTENLLARELGMPTDPEQVTDTLLRGEQFATDVGVINEHRFLAVAGIGFDAECVARMNPSRRGHITHGDYFWPIWRTYWEYRYPILSVDADGERIFDGRGFVLIGNIARYSAGLRMLMKARNDDGLLDLGVFPCESRRKMFGHAFRAFLRRHVGRGGMIYRQCRTVRVSSEEKVPIEVDGELGGCLPAECSVRPGAVSFLRMWDER